MSSFQIGDRVTAEYKTGAYFGEVVEISNSMKAAVRILAVKEHPTQGDLHNPMDPSVAFFHQRRALSYQEIALMPITTIRPYAGQIPDYQDSLKRALLTQISKLSEMEAWARRSLQELDQLQKEYFPTKD
ncbi:MULTISPECIES: kinase-associated lipoprotein B [unclassified Paenibacillus]|jgi:kinase-associated protein B|uniref:kinase-associated lipoprotein B n=1 Tax=unclassified Paenibacillus TaxID=185978 RepID=UPI002780D2E3|nr:MULTISPECIES: kinase-associated lipoprotein B [unclassified Paenibacillus]MDF2646588.1 kinase [Paenibacillus sp.]MDQ0898610.1 kinase-associated protein B [Paenibacillus sp. V4I7]MDQ0915399.1 kinase-associated protein B [Paenibacillus sp. V4I5]